MVKAITEKTLVPISLVVGIGSIVFWVSSVAARGEANQARITKLEEREILFLDMSNKVARIDERVQVLFDERVPLKKRP